MITLQNVKQLIRFTGAGAWGRAAQGDVVHGSPGDPHGIFPAEFPMLLTFTDARLRRCFIGSVLAGLLLGLGCATGNHDGDGLRVTELRCDHEPNPLGTGESPCLGWELQSGHRGTFQSAYQIQVAGSRLYLSNGADVWNSGKVRCGESAAVPYAGKPLQSHRNYYWRVRVWNQDGLASPWSQTGQWTTGILRQKEWTGAWISGREDGTYSNAPSFWFRKSFDMGDLQMMTALCSIASVGYHELYVNGKKVGSDVMAPALSDLSKRALYVTRDIAPYLRKGRNTIAVWLGEGWAGHSGKMWYAQADLGWSREPRFLLQADIHTDKLHLQIASGHDWKCHEASTDSNYPIGFHNLGGELQDDGRYLPGWDAPEFDDSVWHTAIECATSLEVTPQIVQCNQIYEEFQPVAIHEVQGGVYQADMGREFAGWIELQAEAPPGTQVAILTSERQDQASSYGQENRWIIGPEGRGKFCNHFKHQAGRWITVKGLKSPLQAAQLRGFAITTGYERTGHFTCSSEFYNRLYETVLWTFRQLTLDGYLVDCPHRERMGYGDGINAVQSAMSSFGAAPFFTKWSRDWSDVQQPDGNMPFTAPTYNGGGGPMWSSTLVHLPWLTYLYYGDPWPMRDNYPAIRRWMSYLESKCSNHILQWFPGPANIVQPEWSFLGDWVYPGHQQAPNGHERETLFVNNCYYLRTLKTAARIAKAIGQEEEARRYESEAQAAAKAIHEEFWDPKVQSYPGQRQTTPASALSADLPPSEIRPLVEAQLEDRIRQKGHLDTGILGTYFMIEALMAQDRNDLVDLVARRQDYPGWGWMLAQGGTCIWEQWDGNNSRCHSSFLSIGDWFIRGILGIRPDPDAPGFRHFFLEPGVCGNLTYTTGEVDTAYGKIAGAWRIKDGKIALDVQVPANTTATVILPTHDAKYITESGQSIQRVKGVKLLRSNTRQATLEVVSGSYHLTSPMP
jgi:hypothetical protein